jgi:hypothetical protein
VNCYCISREEIWWSGGIAPLILNIGARWRSMVIFTPRSVRPLREAIQVSVEKKSFFGSQSCSGRFEEDSLFTQDALRKTVSLHRTLWRRQSLYTRRFEEDSVFTQDALRKTVSLHRTLWGRQCLYTRRFEEDSVFRQDALRKTVSLHKTLYTTRYSRNVITLQILISMLLQDADVNITKNTICQQFQQFLTISTILML